MSIKSIRKKVKEVMEAEFGEDLVGIFQRRSIPTKEENLPVALIYPNSESVERFDESPKRYRRTLQLTIELISTDDDDDVLSDEMDDLSFRLQRCIEDSLDLNGNLSYFERFDLNSIEYSEMGEGSNPIQSVKVGYGVVYITEEVTRIAGPFLGLDNEFKIVDDDSDNNITDEVDLPQ